MQPSGVADQCLLARGTGQLLQLLGKAKAGLAAV